MIYDEWLKWRNSATEVQDRRVSEQLGKYILDIATKIMRTNSFRGYTEDMKQDMVSEAVLKCIKNLKNLKEERKGSFFNYLTRCCYCAFYYFLSRYYKHVNIRRELVRKAVDELELQTGCHGLAKKLKDSLEGFNRYGDF